MEKTQNSTTYEQFVDKLKEGHVYTWGGRFNADIALATALINQVCDKEGIERPDVHRIYNAEKAASVSDKYVVYGIGYPGCEFDYRESYDSEKTVAGGAPQAAFGRIYNVVGEQLYGDYAEPFAKKFVDKMDACETNDLPGQYKDMIKLMNPNWNDTFSPREAFDNAVRMAEQTLNERLERIQTGHDIGPDYLSSIEEDIYDEGYERAASSLEAAEALVTYIAENNTFDIQGADESIYAALQFEEQPIPSYHDIQELAEGEGFVGYTFPASNGDILYRPLPGQDGTIELPYPQQWEEGHCPSGITINENTGILRCNSMETWERAFTMMVEAHSMMLMKEVEEAEGAEEDVEELNHADRELEELEI